MNTVTSLVIVLVIAIAGWFVFRSFAPEQSPEPPVPDVTEPGGIVTPIDDSKPIKTAPENPYKAGNILAYGADPTGATDSSAALQAAIDQAVVPGGADVLIPAGTFLLSNKVVKDNFDGLVIKGEPGAQIDFRVSGALTFGDHETATHEGIKEPYYVQTSVTASNIVIDGVRFKPVDPGWDKQQNPGRFAFRSPLSLSAVSNVVVKNCQFHDWDFSAIGINAPSSNILIENSSFISSRETKVNYGIRVFAFTKDARINSFVPETGISSLPVPASSHRDITIRNNHFEQASHGIISWNVKGFLYAGNVFDNPTVRTVSLSRWNRDGVLERNIHRVQDNSTHPLSTTITMGMGSERVTIRDEKIVGAMSGEGVNGKLKLIHVTGANKDIVIRDSVFDVLNAAANIQIGPNVGVTIESNYFLQKPITRSGYVLSDVYINDKRIPNPAFTQPPLVIRNNVSLESTRFITLNGAPIGDTNSVEIVGNKLYGKLKNSFLATASPEAGWNVLLLDNEFSQDVGDLVKDYGQGKSNVVTSYERW